MKHKTAFTLCLSVIVLTSAVVASVAMVLFERQDSAALLQRINQLKVKNALLEAQLRNTQQLTSTDRLETADRSVNAGHAQ
jgi:Na+-transporting NADH:ubiquinone oxidoreductase subunit NqrC